MICITKTVNLQCIQSNFELESFQYFEKDYPDTRESSCSTSSENLSFESSSTEEVLAKNEHRATIVALPEIIVKDFNSEVFHGVTDLF